MDIRQFSFDKTQIGGLLAKAYTSIGASMWGIISLPHPLRKAPDDFATRPEIPSWEEYEAASNTQILDRLHRNPAGLLNEQPFIDTLMNVRNAENNRKQTRYMIFGFYALAFSAIVLAFKTPPAPPAPQQDPIAEQQRNTEKAIEHAVGLLKEEFNLKLQSKEIEIKDLKRQIGALNQAQGELSKDIKSLAKSANAPAKPPAHPKSSEPPKPPAVVTKPQSVHKPGKPD